MLRLRTPRPALLLSMLTLASCGESETPRERGDRIHIDTLALLVDDGTHGGVFAGPTPTVRRGPGDGFTAATGGWTRLAVFDGRGRLIRMVGTPGSGPGEFLMPAPPLELPDGRLLVHDRSRGRSIEFDADFIFLREQLAEAPPPLFRTADGFLVASGIVGGPGATGHPAHLLDIEGKRVASFGGTGEPRANPVAEFTGRAAPGPDGLIWLAPTTHYRVELWDPHENRILRVLEPVVEWFNSPAGPVDLATEPPPSLVTGLWQDEDGPVWVLVRRASRSWRAPGIVHSGEFPMTPDLQTDLYEVVLHALNPDSGEILAEIHLDGNLRQFPPGMLLVGRPEVSGGTVTVPVMVPRLAGPNGSGGR